MEYKFRTLTSKDIFPICGILKKIGIKEFKATFNNPDFIRSVKNVNSEDIELAAGLDMVMDILGIIVSNLPNCEKEIYTFLASVIEGDMTVNDLKEIPMADFMEIIHAVITKKEFKDFFKVAMKFLKLEK